MSFTASELCSELGKTALYIRNIQNSLSLPVQDGDGRYSRGYKSFLERVVSLKTFGTSTDDIVSLLELEKKILHIMQVDSLNDSPTWHLEACNGDVEEVRGREPRLLLTNFEYEPDASQPNLDFTGAQKSELFAGAEMGESLEIAIEKYRELEEKILAIVERETPVAERAVEWARSILKTGRNRSR